GFQVTDKLFIQSHKDHSPILNHPVKLTVKPIHIHGYRRYSLPGCGDRTGNIYLVLLQHAHVVLLEQPLWLIRIITADEIDEQVGIRKTGHTLQHLRTVVAIKASIDHRSARKLRGKQIYPGILIVHAVPPCQTVANENDFARPVLVIGRETYISGK